MSKSDATVQILRVAAEEIDPATRKLAERMGLVFLVGIPPVAVGYFLVGLAEWLMVVLIGFQFVGGLFLYAPMATLKLLDKLAPGGIGNLIAKIKPSLREKTDGYERRAIPRPKGDK